MIDDTSPMTTRMTSQTTSGRRRRLVVTPTLVLGLAVAAACALLTLPLSLSIGPMYWDVYQYLDAANRILSGQVPVRDFFAPVGPLGYYLFAMWSAVFPHGQPVLLAQWSALTVTAPLLALVLADVTKRSPIRAYALLVPFLVFALLPFNTVEYYPIPGVDAFGIYNRQICQVLYVVVAATFLVRNRRVLAIVVTVGMLALFFLKINGFAAGGIVVAYAVVAGRMRLRNALTSVTVFVGVLAAIQFATGLVGDYLTDVVELMRINKATLAPRFLQSASLHVGVVIPVAVLATLMLWADRQRLALLARSALVNRSAARLSALLDHPGLWLLVVLFAGIFCETQNLGSQALIFLWPVCLPILGAIRRFTARPVVMVAVATLIAAAMLPSAAAVTTRAARTLVGSLRNVPMANHDLGTMGAVNTRPDVALRAEHMLSFYPEHRAAYDDMVKSDDLPTPLLFSDIDFQVTYLEAVDDAVGAIRDLEAASGEHFDTIMSLNNYNPFPWLMGRRAPALLPIAADPLRTVPHPGPQEQQAVAAADLVLYPTCPPTFMNAMLLQTYGPGLAHDRRITLTECYDAFVNPRFAMNAPS